MAKRHAQPDFTDVNEQIRQEHAQLQQRLSSIGQVMVDRRLSPDEMVRELTSFRDQLQSHFGHEEAGGFFDEITDHAPHLTGRTDALCGEHGEMLGEIGSLLQQAAEGDGSESWWRAIGQAFHGFSKRLTAHEREENELLQETYGDDIGSHD